MPWAPPVFPGLAPALLRAILNRDEIPCDIFYGNLLFSKAIAGDQFFEQHLGKFAISELAFTPYYFDATPDEAARGLWDHARGSARDASLHQLERYEWLVAQAGACLTEIYESVCWENYDIVGFSVMMQQTVPSLALARMIKEEHPEIKIVFGGANCSSPMGEEILARFREIDLVVQGEADAVISQLVRDIRAGREPTAPGVLHRDRAGEVRLTAPARPFSGVNGLPLPDYDPFFEQLDEVGLDHVQPYLQIETSRGCWWGQKHHCSFCSLEDALMEFRSKDDDRVLDEIFVLATRHRYADFFPTDSIINHKFYKTLLPRLAELRRDEELDFSFFFEVKSNLGRNQAVALRAAGVNAVQPGLESFNDHILDLMDKGTSGVRQIQCLKSLAECGIVANWNLIYRNPNESAEDYRETVETMPFLHHIPPLHPEGVTPMLLMRFSPYFERPEAHGIQNIRPATFYAQVFPDPSIDLGKIGFYFDYDHPDHGDLELAAAHEEFRKAIERWRTAYRKDSLLQTRGPGFVTIVDRRIPDEGGEPTEVVLTLEGCRAEMFSYCDQVRSERDLVRTFGEQSSAEEIALFVDEMVARKFIYRSPAGQLITLPLLYDLRARSDALRPQMAHSA